MPKLRVLSGREVLEIFLHLRFVVASQRGSHIKLQRRLADGTRQVLTIPNHSELDKGTLHAIYRQALQYIPESELKPRFYSE
jgi:predicted RNA binding protein YcfA (HicA-like mRNA interferase family)